MTLTADFGMPGTAPWQTMPNTDIDLALRDIDSALEGYEHAEEYDSANMWDRLTLSREGRTLRQADIEFDPNLCSPVIDAVNDRLLITSVTASAGTATDSAASDAATNLVARVIAENQLQTRGRTWNRKALRDGDAYIIVWPDQNFDPDAQPELTGNLDVEDVATPLGVNITYADPRQCRMFYDPENPRKKLFFAQMWVTTLPGEKQERIRVNLFYPTRVEKWISSAGTREKRAADFEHFEDDTPGLSDGGEQLADAVWPMANPYGEVPVFHLRTDYEYGKPEHRNAFAEQAGISGLVEKMMVTAEFSSYPQRYAIQEADSLGNQSIREDPLADHSPADWDHDFNSEGVSLTTINSGLISNETGSEFEANPGSMQLFKNFKAVGQFATADMANFLDPIKQFAQMISTATTTPLWKFSGIGATPPSGESLKVEESGLVQKVLDRMAMLGGEWEHAYEFALKILGVTARIVVSWASPTTNDLKEVWDLAQQQIATGMPRAEAMMRAGIPEAQAQEWATNYSTLFAEAEYQQGRAKMYLAQARLLTHQAVAATIANGVPENVALVEAGYKQADVDSWLANRSPELTMGRMVQMFGQITQGLQQLGLTVQMGIISKSGANAVLVALFGDILPSIPAAALEIDEEDDEDEPDANPFPGPDMLPPGGGLADGTDPNMPPNFGQQPPVGTPHVAPIPMEDR
jgi:hypothetical protein